MKTNLKELSDEFSKNLKLDYDLKKSMYGKKLIVGMGAGSISSWIRDLPKLIK